MGIPVWRISFQLRENFIHCFFPDNVAHVVRDTNLLQTCTLVTMLCSLPG